MDFGNEEDGAWACLAQHISCRGAQLASPHLLSHHGEAACFASSPVAHIQAPTSMQPILSRLLKQYPARGGFHRFRSPHFTYTRITRAMLKMLTSREGFTIDVVALAVRKWILTPYLSFPLAIALSWTSVVSWMRPGLIGYTPAASFTRAQAASRALAVAGALVYLNDYLNRQFANNWVGPSKWNWDEEIVLLTGGSSGIGASIAQHLIARNPRTRIVILDYAPLGWTPPANSRVQYFQCDLSDTSVIREMCAKVRAECGHPTVLVNNAGLIRGRTLMEGTYGDVEATVRVNLIAPMLLAKEVLPEMVRRDHGHIVNVGSVSSLFAPAGQSDYAATKAGLTAVHEVKYPAGQ